MYRFSVARTYTFSATHALPETSGEHPCHAKHWHTYRAEVAVEAPGGLLDRQGFVRDRVDLDAIVLPVIHAHLSERHLNDVLGAIAPTAEQLAEWLFKRLDAAPLYGLARVTIHESPYVMATCARTR